MIRLLKQIQSFANGHGIHDIGEVLELPLKTEGELVGMGYAKFVEKESEQKEEAQTRKRKTKEDKEIYQTKDE